MNQKVFTRLESKVPKLLAEMRQDLRENPHLREFVLLKRAWTYLGVGDDFQYYYDEHPNLDGKVRILQNYGLIEDFRSGNSKRYVITEELADYLADQPTSLGDQTTPTQPYHCLFHREEEIWTLSFGEKAIHVPNTIGLGYIAELLRRPRVTIEAAELAGASLVAPLPMLSSLPKADKQAIDAVKTELLEKEAELAAAAENDWPTRGELSEQISKLKKYLSGAKDHHGGPRKVAGTRQRFRTSVTNAIVRAIKNITVRHPALGQHLSESIITGTSIMYNPAELPEWNF
jgi:hypothetical protein